MSTRIRRETVTFRHHFTVGGTDEVLPPGDYDVETVEEPLEGVSFQAFRRVSTMMTLPPTPDHLGLERVLTIDPENLATALHRDAAPDVDEARERLAMCLDRMGLNPDLKS